tara:strand:+ start:32 stop:334 length:303 start_codon:yes stop_codon:yes gene_type:complete
MALLSRKPKMVEVPENFDIHFREMAEQCREQELMIQALESELELKQDNITELTAVLRSFGYVTDEVAFEMFAEANSEEIMTDDNVYENLVKVDKKVGGIS